MLVYWSTLPVLLWLLAGSACWASAHEIGALRAEYKQVTALQDSTATQRRKVAVEAEKLSARIDSLKENNSAPEERLHDALRASLALVQRVVEVDRQLAELEIRRHDVKGRLRLAYDWEISRLIQTLSQQPDQGLLAQLLIYQQEREILGNEPVDARLQYGEELTINPDDGPDEIRQKMELMEDIAGRLRAEARKNGEQLRRLEEERRLRTRLQIFAREISFFDEHLSEGRVLVRASRSEPSRTDGFEGPSSVVSSEPPSLRSQQEPARPGELMALSGGATDELMLEISKLKAHQQQISQLEAVVRERATAFRQVLAKMLEGEE